MLEKEYDKLSLEDEVKKAVNLMESSTLKQINFIEKLIDDINFCIESSQPTDCFNFKHQISSKIMTIEQAYAATESRPNVGGIKWTVLLGFLWTATSALLNVSLSSVLENIATIIV